MISEAWKQLTVPQTAEEIYAALLLQYTLNGFPTDSWVEGGTNKTRLMAMATSIAELSASKIPAITASGFVDLAQGTGYMALLASNMYQIDQNPAMKTVGTITLTTNGSSGPYAVGAGQLIAVFADTGNRYINSAGGTIPKGGSVDLQFTAENAGASYDDPNAGTITLVNPLPGVTLSNIADPFSSVVLVGAGTGTITPTASPTSPHIVVVRFDSDGDAGVAAWSYSLDGGPYVSIGAAASAAIGTTGITVTLLDGSASPSFIGPSDSSPGDEYTFQNPGSWISSPGCDQETDEALAIRCKARWSTLSNVGTKQLYELLARSTPGVGSQVTQVIVQPSLTENNALVIVVSSATGPLPVGVVTRIETFVRAGASPNVQISCTTPSTRPITLAGTITVAAASAAATEAAINTALVNYLATLPINSTIRVAAIIERIMEVDGVIDVAAGSVTINGGGNLPLGGPGLFVLPAPSPTLNFSYKTSV